MAEKRRRFVVLRLCRWDELELSPRGPLYIPFPLHMTRGDGWPEWYLPVFDTYNGAAAWSEDGKYPIMELWEREQSAGGFCANV